MLLYNKHIFIVEDNLQNRVVFQMALVMNGARVEFERWGHGAVTRLKTFREIDLVILDLTLFNGTSGYDVFNDIRTLPQFDHIPIIAVSAVEPAIAMPKTRQMGFAGFIAKPIDDELFPNQVAQVMNGNQVWYGGERFHGVSS